MDNPTWPNAIVVPRYSFHGEVERVQDLAGVRNQPRLVRTKGNECGARIEEFRYPERVFDLYAVKCII